MRRLVLSALIAALTVIFAGQSAHALSSDPNHFISGDNTFFVYVKAGEKISAEFLRAQYTQPNFPTGDITVTLDGPGLVQKTCTIKASASVGSGCIFAPQSSEISGIWQIEFEVSKGGRAHKEASPDVLWTKNLHTWKITIVDADGEQSGRIWTDRYAFRQPPNNFAGDFTTYYVSEDGYIYRVKNHNYDGQISILSADSIGIRTGDECVSAYQSIEVNNNEELSPALGVCGNTYKLFFEEPSGSLPTESIRWDEATDWVKPQIKKPSISELHFVPDDSSDQLSGDITFYLRNFIGQYQIKIDVDNDGGFDGQNDVTLYEQMKELSTGLQRVNFQGVDRQGQIIFPNQTIGIKVDISKVAEIHFVAVDVEGRDGIEVTRLNGENAPISRLCWNDTGFELTATAIDEPDGRSCPDSSGGVHGWGYGSRSWGNSRYIDDWIFATAKIDGNNTIIYPEIEEKSDGNGQQNMMPILIGGSVVLILAIGATIVLVAKKKRNKGEGPNVPPNDQPPTTPTYPDSSQNPPVPPTTN